PAVGVNEFNGHLNNRAYISGTSYENNTPNAFCVVLSATDRIYALSLHDALPIYGTYTVTTYHNELYFGKTGPSAAKGRRVFSINIGRALVRATVEWKSRMPTPAGQVIKNVEVKDGKLNLELKASANRASISGIAI